MLSYLHSIYGLISYKILLSKRYTNPTSKKDNWKWKHLFQNIILPKKKNNPTQILPIEILEQKDDNLIDGNIIDY
jgi:hypothetical protein